MTCPNCGYQLDPFQTDCPRCAANAARLSASVVTPQTAAQRDITAASAQWKPAGAGNTPLKVWEFRTFRLGLWGIGAAFATFLLELLVFLPLSQSLGRKSVLMLVLFPLELIGMLIWLGLPIGVILLLVALVQSATQKNG